MEIKTVCEINRIVVFENWFKGGHYTKVSAKVDDIELDIRLEGKREDIRIGQKISVSVVIHE